MAKSSRSRPSSRQKNEFKLVPLSPRELVGASDRDDEETGARDTANGITGYFFPGEKEEVERFVEKLDISNSNFVRVLCLAYVRDGHKYLKLEFPEDLKGRGKFPRKRDRLRKT